MSQFIVNFNDPVDKETPKMTPPPSPTAILRLPSPLVIPDVVSEEQLVELPEGFAKPNILSNIPRIPLAIIDIMKNSKISKMMKNRILNMKEINSKQLQDIDKFKEVIILLEKKTPLKKCVKMIYS